MEILISVEKGKKGPRLYRDFFAWDDIAVLQDGVMVQFADSDAIFLQNTVFSPKNIFWGY